MNRRLLFYFFIPLGIASIALQSQPIQAKSPDDLWREVLNAEAKAKEATESRRVRSREAVMAAARFLAQIPADRRSAEVVRILNENARIARIGPAEAAALLESMPIATVAHLAPLEWIAIEPKWRAISALRDTDLQKACKLARELVRELAGRHASGELAESLYADLLRWASDLGLGELEDVVKEFEASPNDSLRSTAGRWRSILDLRSTPLEMIFTAIDGREVDLAKLRGKVVLLEFTGVTWCPACRDAEVALKRLYSQYRDQGLEIVSITYELKPADREKVARLIQERELPWPFSFDGLAHRSPLISRFGVRSFPTTFVLDRTGRLVAHDPKGKKLEQVIVEALATPDIASFITIPELRADVRRRSGEWINGTSSAFRTATSRQY